MEPSAPESPRLSGPFAVSWDVADIGDARLRQLHDYWRKRWREGRPPSRADIDPLDLPRLLPFMFLADVLPDAGDFRFRLVGTHIREYMRIEFTGLLVSEGFPPDFAAEVLRQWRDCVARRAPLMTAGDLGFVDRDHVKWQGIAMPLVAADDVVNMLLGAVIMGTGGG